LLLATESDTIAINLSCGGGSIGYQFIGNDYFLHKGRFLGALMLAAAI